MSKTKLYMSIVFLFFINLLISQERSYVKVLFENSPMPEAYYFSKVDYNGESWVINIDDKLPVNETLFFTSKNSLYIQYQSAKNGNWNVDILFDDIRGMNFFNRSDQLSFWVFLPNQETKETIPNISLILENEKTTNDIDLSTFVKETKVKNWAQIIIPFSNFENELSVDKIKGIKLSQAQTSELNHSFLIDQIEFPSSENLLEITQTPLLLKGEGYERHIDLHWQKVRDLAVRYIKIYRKDSLESDFKPIGIQSPWISGFTDFIGKIKPSEYTYRISFLNHHYQETAKSEEIKCKTKPITDEELLDMVQESHLRYYWEGAEPHSGLALENIPGRTTMIATGASGFGMMAIIAGVHRGFISKEDAVERFLRITRYLYKADRFHGVFPHFLDGETGKVVPFFGNKDNGADLVETSFLMQGLLTAKAFFNQNNPKEEEIRKRITQLWEDVEWDWFRQKSSRDFLTWHWSPDQAWTIDHQLIGWNETMITYFLAIASPSHSVPATMYYTGWSSQSEKAKKYRTNWGQTEDGSMYSNNNFYYNIELPVGVSNGGPLFFTHYSYFGLNPKEVTDIYVNYFDNNQRIAQINQKYSIDNPENHKGYGEDYWGLTASDGPSRYSADEPNRKNDHGKITPTGALSSFPYTPEASMKALKNYYHNYGKELYGFYGFYDAMSLDDHWRSPLFMGLNQAPIVIMIENYRSSLIWDLFMSNKDIEIGLEKLNKETNKRKKL